MLPNWWTRRNLVLAAIAVLACVIGLAMSGWPAPEPVASSALGPDWQCSRLAFVFTTCSRIRHTRAAIVRLAKVPACARLRA